ncbi:MAG: hypothetical protein QNL92_03270 [Octadecabacter sp.]
MFITEITAAIGKGLACAATVLMLGSCQMDSGEDRARQQQALALVADCIATACETLNLDRQSLPDYSVLSDMTHLRAIMISYTDFDDLSVLAPLTGLEEIHIGETNVTDISSLANFPNLQVLHIQNLDTDNYSVLRQLGTLDELAIGNGRLTNIDFVTAMPNLQRLNLIDIGNLPDYPETDLSALEGHAGITKFTIRGYGTTDLSPLLRMPNLKDVGMGSTLRSSEDDSLINALEARGVLVGFWSFPVC